MAKKSTESKPKAAPKAESKAASVETKKELHLWRCTVCGFVTTVPSAEPPEVCPVCGAKKEDFEIAD
jgi:rubrerythrin